MIADDHALILAALRAALEARAGFEVVATAADGFSAIAAVKAHRPDLAVLDLAMPQAGGAEAFAEGRRWSPETRFVILTGSAMDGQIARLVEAGVGGVFLKSGDLAQMLDALPAIMAGGQRLGAEVAARVEAARAPALSPRELQVLQAIAAGLTNAQIGARLAISAKTVDNHRTALMRKLGVHSTASLVMRAVRLRLVDPGA